MCVGIDPAVESSGLNTQERESFFYYITIVPCIWHIKPFCNCLLTFELLVKIQKSIETNKPLRISYPKLIINNFTRLFASSLLYMTATKC